ncbi:MAG: hypothetical protein K0S39_4051 [Paenibacillus sp.]|jgi:hypothetical protein|nr:hypothetical protein [Paenibacillus sp.]
MVERNYTNNDKKLLESMHKQVSNGLVFIKSIRSLEFTDYR